MPNPNNNKHFNDEALRINRSLKKENDKLKELIIPMQDLGRSLKKENDALSEIVDEFEDFLLNINTQWEDDKQSQKLQDMIIKVRSRDND